MGRPVCRGSHVGSRTVASPCSKFRHSPRPRLVARLPPMPIPADNPQNDAKINLGRQLYFDGRLSANNEISCATCHDPKTGWAGHDATDTGVGGRVGNRNSGTIVNSGYMKYQFWDGRAEFSGRAGTRSDS